MAYARDIWRALTSVPDVLPESNTGSSGASKKVSIDSIIPFLSVTVITRQLRRSGWSDGALSHSPLTSGAPHPQVSMP